MNSPPLLVGKWGGWCEGAGELFCWIVAFLGLKNLLLVEEKNSWWCYEGMTWLLRSNPRRWNIDDEHFPLRMCVTQLRSCDRTSNLFFNPHSWLIRNFEVALLRICSWHTDTVESIAHVEENSWRQKVDAHFSKPLHFSSFSIRHHHGVLRSQDDIPPCHSFHNVMEAVRRIQ